MKTIHLRPASLSWRVFAFGVLLCGAGAVFAAPARQTITLLCATNQVGQYERLDFALQVSSTYTNPFDPDEVDLRVRLTEPGGRRVSLPAFWCQAYEYRKRPSDRGNRAWLYPTGEPGWQARFAPMKPGRYEAVAVLHDKAGSRLSEPVRFECLPGARDRGFLRVSRKDARFLEFANGEPFFAIGQNLAFIGSQQYVTLPKAEEIFKELEANGANYLRVWTCCDDWAMAIEARKSAWGRSWDWRPSIVPVPEGDGRKRLKISGENASLRVEPSHPVALRPDARYVLTGKVRTEGSATLKVESLSHQPVESLAPGPEGTWSKFSVPFETRAGEYWLNNFMFRLSGSGTAWLSDVSIREADGGPELLWEADVNRLRRGFYNPLDCWMLDEILRSAEQHGIFLQLCLLTRDLYMGALKDPASPQYEAAVRDARKLLRYAVARWGYSTHVAAWEYWNEMDPGLPTDRLYSEVGEYLEEVDVYHHLRTTSTWGPSAKDCRHPKLDLADTHFYLRPADKGRLLDEVDAVLERTRWLREQAPNKPARLGEFGLADDKWRITREMQQSSELADIHNALWASGLSGASGTALFWWWERLDQRDGYAEYGPLSRFLADVPWTTGALRSAGVTCGEARARVVGLQSRHAAWLWLFNPEASWGKLVLEKNRPQPITGLELQLNDLPDGKYRVEWWNTRLGTVLREDHGVATQQILKVRAPDFLRDLACKVRAEGK